MSNSKNALRMVCLNPDCLNKAIVYRQYSALKDQTCSGCNQPLTAAPNRRFRVAQLVSEKLEKRNRQNA